MEINELKTFVTVAQCHSFSKAAIALDYSQAAITVQIKNLEKELGIHLFDRLGKTISLTNQGATFYEKALIILKDIDDAYASVGNSEELTGHLTIGTIDSLCTTVIADVVDTYHKLYPHVTISVTTDSIKGLLSKLKDNTIDLAYLVDEPITDLSFTKVSTVEEPTYFISSIDYKIKKKLELDDLLKEKFILTEPHASYRSLLDQFLNKKGVSLDPIIETENTHLIVNLVKKNMGISFLPEYMIQEEMKKGTLKTLNVPCIDIHVERQLLHHKDKWVSAEMKAFFEVISH